MRGGNHCCPTAAKKSPVEAVRAIDKLEDARELRRWLAA